ncbi:MAG TPA: class I SAM-dependent methyltransferase [Opitutales bacterium]|jgi:ubiquinone/menaquinone biosynthesis C-methylase UbiE|nr:class I SAM-dependent methyltransferase [Opitutales bacterium]
MAQPAHPVAENFRQDSVGNQGAQANFDPLARVYFLLEYAAFGRELERARFCFLEKLRNCRDILLLGEGDGRCMARLAQIAPQARLHCVDASQAMLHRAAARLDAPTRSRVTFTCAEVQAWTPPVESCDAVVTLFFLDCFSPETVAALVARMQPALRPGALWLFADFILPASGFARWRAQVWLRVMYCFFRWQTGLAVKMLPPSEAILRAAGWKPQAIRDFHGVFVRSVLFSQPGCGS